jgi:hypothetical protein
MDGRACWGQAPEQRRSAWPRAKLGAMSSPARRSTTHSRPATNRLSLRVVVAGITVADDADRRTKPPAHVEHITCPSTVAGELRECSSAQR